MARPRKAGLLYFPLDVDIFDADFKITDLMNRYGPKGFTIFAAVLCLVYREGYYLEIPPKSLNTQLIKMIGNKWINDNDFVPEVMDFCGELGLFDAGLLSQGVITSRAIQRRYQEATKRNKVDTSKYWLLDASASGASESIPGYFVSAAKTPVSVTKTPVSAAKTQQIKGKEIKENKMKRNETRGEETDGFSPAPAAADYKLFGRFHNVRLTEVEYKALCEEVNNAEDLIETFSLHIKAVGDKYIDHFARLLKWDKEDRTKGRKSEQRTRSASYDIEAFEKSGFELPETEEET